MSPHWAIVNILHADLLLLCAQAFNIVQDRTELVFTVPQPA